MAYVPNSGSVVAFQSNPSVLQATVGLQSTNASVITVGSPVANQSVSGTVGASVIGAPPANVFVGGALATTANPLPVSPPLSGFFPVTLNSSTNASVITVSQGSVGTVIVGGSIAASFTPPANQSVSGTVQTDVRGSVATVIIGGSILTTTGNSSVQVLNFPANQSVSGTVTANQGTTPWIITGSIQGGASANQSVSGTVGASLIGLSPVTAVGLSAPLTSIISNPLYVSGRNQDGSVGALYVVASALQVFGSVSGSVGITGNPSISGTVQVGNFPTTQNVSGSVVATQGTTPWIIGSIYGNISGSVAATVTNTNVNVGGSVVAFQGTTEWTVKSSVSGGLFPISGSVAATITNTNVNISGSVAAFVVGNASLITLIQGSVAAVRAGQIGTVITSISGIPQASVHGAVSVAGGLIQASVHGAVTFQVASLVSGHGSVNGAASVQVLSAPGTGLYNYITDFTISNTGAATTLVTFTDGDGSVLGKTIAPAGGGSNATALSSPMRTMQTNKVVNIVAATATSVLHAWIGGYKAP